MASSLMMDALRLLVGLVILGVASWMDIRTRKVPNRVWFFLLLVAIFILEADLVNGEAEPVLLLTPLPVILIFVVIFTEGEPLPDRMSSGANAGLSAVLVLVAVAVLWYQGDILAYSVEWLKMLHIPIMLVLAYLFYFVRLLHGGADAKALMGIAVLVPYHPVLGDLPLVQAPEAMNLILPFAFIVLVNSALMTLLVPLGFALYNLARRDVSSLMFFGYRLPLKVVPKRFVWLMEKVEDGDVVVTLFPKRGERDGLKKELKALRKAGITRPWVTPKIPFMVPMWFGFLLSFMAGNLIFGLIDVLM